MTEWLGRALKGFRLGGLLLALSAGGAVALALAGPAASTSTIPGSWTISGGKVIDTETNNTGKPILYFYLVLPSGVTISAPAATGYECVVGQPNPPGGSNVVECQAPPPNYWANGASVTLSFTAAGLTGTPTFQKWVSFDGSTYQGPYDVPPAGSSTTTSTTSTSTVTLPPPKCHCARLSAKAANFGFHHEGDFSAPKGGPVTMYFDLNWSVNCVPFGGNGGCNGTIKVDPPPGHNIKVAISQTKTAACNNPKKCPPHFTTPRPGVIIHCTGHCGLAGHGVARVRIVGDDTLDAAHIAGKDLTFVLKETCSGKPGKQKITFHFGRTGRFDPKHSHLGG